MHDTARHGKYCFAQFGTGLESLGLKVPYEFFILFTYYSNLMVK